MDRLCLGRLLEIGTVDCQGQSAVRLPILAQLQPIRPSLVLKASFRLADPTRVPIPRKSPSPSTIISLSLVPLYFYHFMRYVLCLERLALYFLFFCSFA